MGIKGFQGTSLLDFPGRIASLVFWGGCNLTCPFCHNQALVLEPEDFPDMEVDALLENLAGRRTFIDGVVVSGGEPTLSRELIPFLVQVKKLGLLVKLDTNGLAPQVVERLLTAELIDYLAIDLKTAPELYSDLHPAPVSSAALLETVGLSLKAQIELEFRTTCVPGWVDEDVIRQWGERIAGAPLWSLQQYHAAHALTKESRDLRPFTAGQIEMFADVARQYVGRVVVRGL